MERAKTVGYKLLMQLLHFAIVLIGISFLTFPLCFYLPEIQQSYGWPAQTAIWERSLRKPLRGRSILWAWTDLFWYNMVPG